MEIMKKLILGSAAFVTLIAPALAESPERVQETVIYTFTGSNSDGIQPLGDGTPGSDLRIKYLRRLAQAP
jgi:hypothetical protein